MKDFYYSPKASALFEITEKRSKFIAEIHPAANREQAEEFIGRVRARHRDARHTVFAYIFDDGDKRYSDDGEPSGTAGAPIMDILEKNGICNCALTVTRYFGGILLGTGGLVRAYSAAASGAVENCSLEKSVLRVKAEICCGYNLYNRIPSILSNCGGRILTSDFSEDERLSLSLDPSSADGFSDQITEISAGETTVKQIGTFYEKSRY